MIPRGECQEVSSALLTWLTRLSQLISRLKAFYVLRGFYGGAVQQSKSKRECLKGYRRRMISSCGHQSIYLKERKDQSEAALLFTKQPCRETGEVIREREISLFQIILVTREKKQPMNIYLAAFWHSLSVDFIIGKYRRRKKDAGKNLNKTLLML